MIDPNTRLAITYFLVLFVGMATLVLIVASL